MPNRTVKVKLNDSAIEISYGSSNKNATDLPMGTGRNKTITWDASASNSGIAAIGITGFQGHSQFSKQKYLTNSDLKKIQITDANSDPKPKKYHYSIYVFGSCGHVYSLDPTIENGTN